MQRPDENLCKRLEELSQTETKLFGSDAIFMDERHRFEDEEGERMRLHPWSGLPSVIYQRATLPPRQAFHSFWIGDGIHRLWEYYDIFGSVKWSYVDRDERAARYYAGWRT